MTLSQDEREKLADKHGLKRSALRWAKGDTPEELEADIQELLEDGFRADGTPPPAATPPTRTPREALRGGDENPDEPLPLTPKRLDVIFADGARIDEDAPVHKLAAQIEGMN